MYYCSDFPFVVPECGYKGAKEAASLIASEASLSSSEVEWMMGKTLMQLFQGQWLPQANFINVNEHVSSDGKRLGLYLCLAKVFF